MSRIAVSELALLRHEVTQQTPLVSHMKLQNGATQDGEVSNVTCLGNIPYRTDRQMNILITQQA